LIDWQGDLYDKELNVDLVKFIRPKQKFTSLDALKDQIKVDCQTALTYFVVLA
jgi:riboflavin kinase/FMN adenylyltransferase